MRIVQKENALRKYEYQFIVMASSGLANRKCKSKWGEDFWEEYLQKAIEAGRNIGKTDLR